MKIANDEYLFALQKRAAKRLRSRYFMRRIDRHSVPDFLGEVRLFMSVRNEELRLPWFLDYYFKMGVDRMFVVDNDSTDRTLSLLDDDRIHVYQTRESYEQQGTWMDILLRKYGVGHWCFVVDVDEFFSYPGKENLPLKDFLGFLDQQKFNAVHALLLDMYSKGPVRLASYTAGSDPFSVTPWYDPMNTHREEPFAFRNCTKAPSFRYFGGMRGRVFGRHTCCSKFPLVRFDRNMFLLRGAHVVEGAQIADIRAVLFHFKYFSDFAPRCQEEAERGIHWNNASEYKAYNKQLQDHRDMTFWYEGSRSVHETQSLLGSGHMQASSAFKQFFQRF